VLARLIQLFKRYAIQHGTLEKRGFDLIDTEGEVFGFLDRISLRHGRLVVEGWVHGDMVGLICGDERRQKSPFLFREDVPRPRNSATYATPGFVLDLPMNLGRKHFWARHNGSQYVYALPDFNRRDLSVMRRRLAAPFIRDGLRALPAAFAWFTHRDAAARARVKSIMGFNEGIKAQLLRSDLFLDTAPGATVVSVKTDTAITIILPVYNAFDLLQEVLQRVLDNTDLPYRLIIVEDASPDDRVRPFLQQWHANLPADVVDDVQIIENEVNQGFIRSVNRAFEAALPHGDHVVLLNSDAFVPAGWASRLIAPMLSHQNVASVTPMSNDAEIFNVPTMGKPSDLIPGQADALDNVAQRLNPDATFADAPTGVGFCMAMNIKYVTLEPQFDTIFGRGYGEEVDWCRRVTQRHGGRHLGHAGMFVEHRGGSSFGSTEKLKLVLANNQIIADRYQGYDQLVQDFIQHDPLSSPRLALGLAWAGLRAETAVPVYLAHDMGGGAEHYLQRRISDDLSENDNAAAVILRVGGALAWQIELYSQGGSVLRGETDDIDLVKQMLDLLPARRMVYSCAVGAREPLAVPALLTEMADGAAHELEVLFHDFLPLSPSYTLLDEDGVYRGVPKAGAPHGRAHQITTAAGRHLTLSDWRAAWGEMMQSADHITVFSGDSADIVAEAYPQASARIRIRPHEILHPVPTVSPGQAADDVPVIGILGNIGLQKGASLLQDLSRQLAKSKRARLVVIGNIDPTYTLAEPARVHGSYVLEDIPGLVARYGISQWLIPSIWPETFSYATHEAIATGLPVWSFDLGAQGQSVAAIAEARGQGGTIPLAAVREDVTKLLEFMLPNAQ
tara:strand:+ start:116839 stop:119373 length:2535 start_codon:yes stop_codon:yes gene_type:complete